MPATVATHSIGTHGPWPYVQTPEPSGRRVVVTEAAGRVLHGYAPPALADGAYSDAQITAGVFAPLGLPVRTAAQELAAVADATAGDRRVQVVARQRQRVIDRVRVLKAKAPATRTIAERSDLAFGLCILAALSELAELDDSE